MSDVKIIFMKNLVSLLVILIFIAAVFGGYKSVVFAASQSDSEISPSGDLCGGTGGNGEIVNIGSNTFTLKLREGGGNLIVNLTNRATIETSTGNASLSDLKIGDRVTLVGDSHRDGTFTADTVVLCNKTQQTGTQEIRNNNLEEYEKVSGTINTATMFLVGLVWFSIASFLRLKKKESFVYLLFFTIFYIYLYKVLDYTLLQFQSLLLLQHFVPALMLRGVEAGRGLNLIPLATLRLEDVITSLFNILMMMPFGFGLPFITNLRIKKVVVAGLFSSIVIEFFQLITGFMANTTFRVADINDLIFNTIGVAIGYVLFVGFVHIYRHAFRNWKISNPILRYIARRPQVDK
jgi:glycopeptide antibiotics resistance protein